MPKVLSMYNVGLYIYIYLDEVFLFFFFSSFPFCLSDVDGVDEDA